MVKEGTGLRALPHGSHYRGAAQATTALIARQRQAAGVRAGGTLKAWSLFVDCRVPTQQPPVRRLSASCRRLIWKGSIDSPGFTDSRMERACSAPGASAHSRPFPPSLCVLPLTISFWVRTCSLIPPGVCSLTKWSNVSTPASAVSYVMQWKMAPTYLAASSAGTPCPTTHACVARCIA
eukprot:scaffold6767_cov223-Isochrysis_galbana.AAC.13